MNEQENFDDLIRQKFAEKEFVFNEENWEKAEKKIDSKRKFSKIFLWTSIFIIGIFIGVGITLLFVEKDNYKNKNKNSEINIKDDKNPEIPNKGNTTIENPNSTLPVNKQKENELSQKTEENKISPETESVTATNGNQLTEKNVSAPSNTKTEEKELTYKNNTGLSPVASNDKKTETIKKENKTYKTEQNLTANKTINFAKKIQKNASQKSEEPVKEIVQNAETSIKGIEKSEKNSKAKSSLIPIRQTEKQNEQTQTTAINNTQPEKENSITPSNPDNQSEINLQKNNIDVSLKSTVPNNDSINETNSELAMTSSADEKKSNLDTAATLQSSILPENEKAIPKSDSAAVSNENKSPLPPVAPGSLASATIFSINAGTNFELGWKYPETNEGGGFTPVLGIGITHFFNQKWSLQSGIEYGNIAYLKASQKVFSTVTYGFGSTTVDKVINTKMLHYAIVPVLFQYHFNDKNAISFGGSISYLVNSKSKVTINTTKIVPMVLDSNQTDPIENEITSTQSVEAGYYSNAFNNWDASLAMGYRRRISQKFSITAITNFGLLDIKNNAFFSRDTFERNVGLKIIISYNLFEF